MKYSKEIIEEIVSYLEAGNTSKDACELANISEETFHTWKREKPEFSESVMRAKVKCKAKFIKTIQDSKDWRAHAWWLEHRYPKEYSLKHYVEIQEVEDTALSDEELDRINRFLLHNDRHISTDNFTPEEKDKVDNFMAWVLETQKVRDPDKGKPHKRY